MEETKIHEILKQGEDFFAAGEIEKAKKCFENVLATDSKHMEALNNLGVIYFHKGDLNQAVRFFHRALEIDGAYAEAIENLANCLLAKGDFLEAVNLFEKTFELGILNINSLNAMAQCFIRLGDISSAKHLLNESLKVDPRQEDARALLKEIEQPETVSGARPHRITQERFNVGFVSIWFERGQAYVTKTLRDVISEKHNTFIFARTGGVYGQPKLETTDFWDVPNLTTYPAYKIPPDILIRWIRANELDVVVFNEEYDWEIVRAAKNSGLKVLAYLDYYKEDWKPFMGLYDAVLCSTLRTYNLVKDCCNAHYMGWAVDTDLFRPRDDVDEKHTFFHNAGWLGINYRKMTPAVILAFDAVSRHMPDITLFVHAQTELKKLPAEVIRIVGENPRITYHVETVPAPGLYHKGRVLVFPSKLEGLGLPLLEGLACGLPAIATDAPPMNEFVKDGYNGLLVRVAQHLAREDNIAFPEAIVDIDDLARKMAKLTSDPSSLEQMKQNARDYAKEELNFQELGARISSCIDKLFNNEEVSTSVSHGMNFQFHNNVAHQRVVHLVGAQETNYPWGFENRLISAFESIGCTVISTDYRKNRKDLPRLIQVQADLLLVCKGEGITPEVIRSAPCTTVLWYAEQVGSLEKSDPPADIRRGELAYNISAFDYVFSHDQRNLDVYRKLGARKVGWLPTAAVDPSVHQRLGLRKIYDVTFVGTLTPRRKLILDALSRKVNVNVLNVWEPHELNRIFNQAKIVLNIHLSDLLNTETRIAEVLGAGAFMLTEALSMKDFLIDGKHLVFFAHNSIEDCLQKIGYYLEHDSERESIARVGHEFVNAHHTYENRVQQLLGYIDFDLRKDIWPSYSLGFAFDSDGRPTLRLDSFYNAVSRAMPKAKRLDPNADIRRFSSRNKEGDQSALEKKDITKLDLKASNKTSKSSCIDQHTRALRIFASFANVNWEDNNLQPALEEFGEVIRFRWDFNDQYRPDWHTIGKTKMNQEMWEALRSAHNEKPIDVFFGYLSGRTVFPGIIKAIGLLGIPTINISLDDKAKFVGNLEPTGHAGLVDIANAFTLCWTTDKSAVAQYEGIGAKTIYMPPGATPDVFHPHDLQRDIDVCFIGQKYGRRPRLIAHLREHGISVRTFGPGWESGGIPIEEMVRLFSHSKITLGISTVGDATDIICIKGRDFEVPMSGGFYMTQYNHDLEEFFEVGKEIVCYESPEDLVEKIRYHLAHPQEAEDIRQAGLRRSIRDHTWVDRFRRAFETMGLLPSKSGEACHPCNRNQTMANPEVKTKDDWTYYLRVGKDNAENKKESIKRFVLSKQDIKSILDVGCNTGEMSAQFLKYGIKVLGLDASNNLRFEDDYQFLQCDISETNEVIFNDCTFFLSLYHHLFNSKGKELVDDIFHKLLLRTKYLVFDTGNILEKGRDRQHWIEALKSLFCSEKDLLDHFGLPYSVIGSWETGCASRAIVVFEKESFDDQVEVVDEFRRKVGSPSQAEGLFSIKNIPADLEFFDQTHFHKLKLGDRYFFAKKHLLEDWEASERENTIEVYRKFPKDELLTFYGISERFGFIYEWVDNIEYVEKMRDVRIYDVLLHDGDKIKVDGKVKYIDFWSAPAKKVGKERAFPHDRKIQQLLGQGEKHFFAKDQEGAKRCFQEILSLDSGHIEANNNLGVIAFQYGQVDDAISYFAKVIETDENYLEAIENMGKCCEAKEDYGEAVRWFEKALSSGGKSTEILNHIGNCYIQFDDLSNAMEVYAESLRLDGTQEIVKTLLKGLETTNNVMIYQAVHRDWEKRGRPVPPPHLIKQYIVKEYAKRFSTDILIETGTYLGGMIYAMRNCFKEIFSIELDSDLANRAKSIFSEYPHIHIIEADSGIALAKILERVEEPCVFWMDAHYSGGITTKGDLETPILEELKHILVHRIDEHVILIDDARCFSGENDYPAIEALKKFVMQRHPGWVFEVRDDVIRLHKKVTEEKREEIHKFKHEKTATLKEGNSCLMTQ